MFLAWMLTNLEPVQKHRFKRQKDQKLEIKLKLLKIAQGQGNLMNYNNISNGIV